MASNAGVSQIMKHDEYYLKDGNITFLAEGTLFRVHKSFFERESEFFRTLFAPSSKDSDEGSDVKPYTLDVQSIDFAQFLWVWYNQDYTYSRDKKAWLVTLRLATRWDFPKIRMLAIRQLEELKLQPVEKIAMYKEYKVDNDLLLPSYMALCRSPTLPSPSDGELLTMETVLKLANARERALLDAAASGCESPTSASASDEVLGSIIAELFGLTPQSNGGTTVGMRGQASSTSKVPTLQKPEPTRKGSQNTRTNGEQTTSASNKTNDKARNK
ncbi:hypothetical protein BS17DRAFT_877718 [Gyrodon lividus]|nr:hypothetical protein BS17DRAFT_877718 [Gyrodon lividus]